MAWTQCVGDLTIRIPIYVLDYSTGSNGASSCTMRFDVLNYSKMSIGTGQFDSNMEYSIYGVIGETRTLIDSGSHETWESEKVLDISAYDSIDLYVKCKSTAYFVRMTDIAFS